MTLIHRSTATAFVTAMAALAAPAFGQTPATSVQASPPGRAAPAVAPSSLKPCTSVTVDPPTELTLGKSRVIRLDFPAARIVVGGQPSSRAGRPVATPAAGSPGAATPGAPAADASRAGDADSVADTEITLLSPTELFFLGRKTGSMNVVVQSTDGRCVVKDIVVTVDPATLQATLGTFMPDETNIKVRGAQNSLVLTGSVSDLVKLDQVLNLATSYGDARKVVNLLRVTAPQQVMLEVKIAEVSKNLLDKLGASVGVTRATNGGRNIYSLISNFLSGGGGLLQALRGGRTAIDIDAEKTDGLVRVLAEPAIMAISGQAASFLSGGKIFIPVAQTSNAAGGSTITLEEKEFGVGLKFTPTVLDGNRINLKLVSEASELSQTGSPFTSVNGSTSVIPSLTTRRVDTTVQLGDGESFVVAGLIRNNVKEAIEKIPGVGEVPVVGALFRSTEFQSDQTELMFVVTPRLVKPLVANVTLPTDNHVVPDRTDAIFNGRAEGAPRSGQPAIVAPTQK
jgi:pilus assembly protein CpaC